MRVLWYRFRVTFRRRWAGYLTLAVLIGLVGGVGRPWGAGARRTDSSYPKFLASTNPSDLIVQPNGGCCSYQDVLHFLHQVAGLPHVKQMEIASAVNAATITPRGGVGTDLQSQVQLISSADGLFANQDRVTITQGRAVDLAHPNEVVASMRAAALLHLRVGSRVPVGVWSGSQEGTTSFYRKLDLTVVGVGVFNTQVLQDDIDSGRTGFLLGAPALFREFSSGCTSDAYIGLRLTGGSRDDTAVEREYENLENTSSFYAHGGGQLLQVLQVYDTSAIEAEAQQAIRPEAIALGVFGVIAGLAALIIGTQSISRQLRAAADDTGVLRALGAGPAALMADGLLGVLAAVAAGSLLAAAVAVGLSPFSLFGPVRQVDPGRGIYADATVLGLGVAGLALVLGGTAAIIAYRQAPHRVAAREQAAGRRPGAVRAMLAPRLPASGVEGMRLALEPGRGRTAVPVRSVIAGAVLAMTVVTATLTFGASLTTLITHPALYGWNFSYAYYAVQGWGSVPVKGAAPLRAHDRDVAATTGVSFVTVQVDGQTIPAIVTPTRSAVRPHVLSGHCLAGSHQVVLGPATLAQRRRRFGDTVTLASGDFHVRLRIAGTAPMPAIGGVRSVHASMSTGAVFSTAVLPGGNASGPFGPLLSGPNAILVRLRPGVSQTAGLGSLKAIRRQLTQVLNSPRVVAASGGSSFADTIDLLPAQRPAEIVNYRSMGTMPAILAGGLAAGAVAALGLTLVASVRRRRRDFALLKTLGFTRRQIAAAVAWQSTVIAAAGLVIGVPLGIAAGRWLWLLFARQLSAVPDPVIPAVSIALAALAAVILANLVAAIPGRSAARTRAALVLRSE